MKINDDVWNYAKFTALSSMLVCSNAMARDVFPDSIQGTWQIEEVHINTFMPSKPDLISDDPVLVGRMLKFTKNSISGDILVEQGCVKPNYTKLKDMSFDSLLKKTSEYDGSGTSQNNAISYGFKLSGSNIVHPVTISCGQGMLGPKGNTVDNWLVYDNNAIITNWDSDSYLVLKRLPERAQPHPSFDCVKQNTNTEKAICSSYDLSSWDRSVANAYEIARRQIKNIGDNVELKTKKLSEEQSIWLKERNSCGADAECLQKKMSERTEFLVELAK